MANLKLAQTYDAWRGVVRRRAESRRELMRKAINLMREPLLTTTFYAWRELREAAASAEAKLSAAISMWRSRLLVQSFAVWEDFVASQRNLRRRAAGRAFHSLLARAFAAWAAEVKRLLHVYGLLRQVANRIANRLVTTTFTEWRDHVRGVRGTLSNVVGRWENSPLARAFDTWRDQWAENTRLLRLGRRVLKRITDGLVSRVFRAWAQVVLAKASASRDRQHRALSKLSGRPDMIAKTVLAEWHTWASAEAKRRSELAKKMHGRYLHQGLVKTFLAWQGLAMERIERHRRQMLVAAQFLSGKSELLKQVAFETYRQYVRDTKQRREELVFFALMRIHKGLLHVVFHAWSELVSADGRSGGGGAGGDDPGPVVAALRGEVTTLRSQLDAVRKALAMQERSKAYRFEVSAMRDELHSFLFSSSPARTAPLGAGGGTPQAVQRALAALDSDSMVNSSDGADSDDGYGTISPQPQTAPASHVLGGRPPSAARPSSAARQGRSESAQSFRSPVVGARPRSGGSVGRAARDAIASGTSAARARPASARAAAASGPFRVPAQPQTHQWPVVQQPQVASQATATQDQSKRVAQYEQGYAYGLAYDAALLRTAAGAQASQAMRARPPSASSQRRLATDRPSPRARMLTSSAEVKGLQYVPDAPHFSCSSIQASASSGSARGSRLGAAIPERSTHLAWASRTHFSQLSGGAMVASPGAGFPPIN